MLFETERQTVVELCQQLSQRGFFAATGGNLMLRLDARQVAVTPSATDYASLSAADVCVLNLSDLSVVEAQRSPSVESSLHARVLRRRADLQCSIHTHQPLASACALLGAPLDVPAEQQPLLGKRVPVVGYAPSGTTLLARRLERAVDAHSHAWLMRNHGVLCAAADSDTALAAIEALERLAAAHLNRLIGQRLERMPPAKRDALAVLQNDLQQEAAL
ncbi:class II aldolase/adducin family protein [Saccharospirillum mangrovi]|uniref:class II aldolase/adducin family protein n=1 Tax=Saccharospirillum mangrovi TaxID=2161747 RepID=UPI000D335291|nr:class II aldolase/adducin family protein [Saccharospirillum mangrovi]